MEKMTMTRLAELIPDEASAYKFLEQSRWKGVAMCSHCHGTEVTQVRPENGTDKRRTRTGAMSARRLWQCNGCRKQFSVLTGTVMHGTKISVRIWVMVMFEFAANKNGIAAREVERRYGLSPRSAWHLLHRIREAMGNDALTMLGGEGHVIVADETFIGGSFKNTHKSKIDREPVAIIPGEGARRPSPIGNKTAVLTLIDTNTGEARSRVVPDVTGASLRKAIADQVLMSRSTLHTDESGSYNLVASEFAAHESVNHSADEYVRYTEDGIVTSNQAENFFSQLKRSLDGTHHHVSAKHLHRYLAEFDYRYSTRGLSDTERFAELIDRTDGIRLAYRPLAAA